MDNIKLTKEDILHIALLSMINITDDSVDRIRKDLESVMSYVTKLFEIDTENVPETAQVTGLVNVFRADKVSNPSGKDVRDKMLANAPLVKSGYVVVPRVLY